MKIKLGKIKKLLKQNQRLLKDIKRSESTNIPKINAERQILVEEVALDGDGNDSIVYNRRIKGNLNRLANEQALLATYRESLDFINQSILKEALKIWDGVMFSLKERADQNENRYQKENLAVLAMKKELMKRQDALAETHNKARRARDAVYSYDRRWTAQMLADVIDDPCSRRELLSSLPVIAQILGDDISEQYKQSCDQYQKQCEQEMRQANEKQQKRTTHLKALRDKAMAMIKRGEVPAEFRTTHNAQQLTANMLVQHWLSKEQEVVG